MVIVAKLIIISNHINTYKFLFDSHRLEKTIVVSRIENRLHMKLP